MSDKDKSKVRVIKHLKLDSLSLVPLSQARFGGRILHVIKGTAPGDPPGKEDNEKVGTVSKSIRELVEAEFSPMGSLELDEWRDSVDSLTRSAETLVTLGVPAERAVGLLVSAWVSGAGEHGGPA